MLHKLSISSKRTQASKLAKAMNDSPTKLMFTSELALDLKVWKKVKNVYGGVNGKFTLNYIT